jgi:hypothetical protein
MNHLSVRLRAMTTRPFRRALCWCCFGIWSCKSKRPIERWAVLCKDLGDDLLSHGLSHTTIGAAAFHFRVRDGIGWYHSAMVAKETVECRML